MNLDGQLSDLDLVDAQGNRLTKRTECLTEDEADTMRRLRRMLDRRGFRILLRCDVCFEQGRPSGMKGAIGPDKIKWVCRCRRLRDAAAMGDPLTDEV